MHVAGPAATGSIGAEEKGEKRGPHLPSTRCGVGGVDKR